jgi:hypothetical protein
MDDDDYLFDCVSVNAESEDEFAINSQEENNFDPLNDDEVLTFDCVFSCTLV